MLSAIADALLSATRSDRWDAPDYYKQSRRYRSNLEIEREAAEGRYRAMRDAGMW